MKGVSKRKQRILSDQFDEGSDEWWRAMGRSLRVGVAGVGFVGRVHIRSARLAGAHVVGIAEGSQERAESAATELSIPHVFASAEAMMISDEVDVVHICTPNALHVPLAQQALKAGKHVLCEKPLATRVDEARLLVELARDMERIAVVPFAYRFHPMVREVRDRVRSGETGDLHLIHGSYLQDFLSSPDDYNWRTDPTAAGESCTFADIGVHWCDLVEFVSGHRITELSAQTITAYPERTIDESKMFAPSSPSGAENGHLQYLHDCRRGSKEEGRVRVPVGGEDAITMMFRTDNGAAGTVVVSQVSHGRKNRLWFELDGVNEALSFDQEDSERLWLGRRSGSQLLVRDPATLSEAAAPYAVLPPGHAQGYADTFDALVKDAYAVINGESRDGLPTFEDGLRAAQITEAVLRSARDEKWVTI